MRIPFPGIILKAVSLRSSRLPPNLTLGTFGKVLDEVRNEVDTFGLVETNLNGVGEEEKQSDDDWDSLRPFYTATGIDHCVVNTYRCKLRNQDLRH